MNYGINDSEIEILGLFIDSPEFLDKTILKENYFKNKYYGNFFKTIKYEFENKKVLLPQSLIENDNFDFDLYTQLLSSCIYKTNRDAKFIELERLIIDDYKKRVINKILEDYVSGDIIYSKMFSLLQKVNNITYQDISYITTDDMEKEIFTEQKSIKFKYDKLSSSLNLIEHDLLVMAGTTGSGKTAFALNLLEDLSNKYQCIYFNLEMSKSVLYKRLVALQTKIPLLKLNDFKSLDEQQKLFVNMSIKKYNDRKIALVNNSQSIDSIKRFIANFKTDSHFIVFIDHIGLINSKLTNSYERATEIAKELRRISLDYNCTIIALCQLSRKASEDNEGPKLSHLRDSGEIEQSARKVILLNPLTKTFDRNQNMDVVIAKNDNGTIKAIPYTFDRYCQCFYENKEEEK